MLRLCWQESPKPLGVDREGVPRLDTTAVCLAILCCRQAARYARCDGQRLDQAESTVERHAGAASEEVAHEQWQCCAFAALHAGPDSDVVLNFAQVKLQCIGGKLQHTQTALTQLDVCALYRTRQS